MLDLRISRHGIHPRLEPLSKKKAAPVSRSGRGSSLSPRLCFHPPQDFTLDELFELVLREEDLPLPLRLVLPGADAAPSPSVPVGVDSSPSMPALEDGHLTSGEPLPSSPRPGVSELVLRHDLPVRAGESHGYTSPRWSMTSSMRMHRAWRSLTTSSMLFRASNLSWSSLRNSVDRSFSSFLTALSRVRCSAFIGTTFLVGLPHQGQEAIP